MRIRIHLVVLVVCGAVWATTAEAGGGKDKTATVDTIKDRTGFIPYRKYQPLAGTVVGVLVSNPQPILSTEGRGSALENYCLSLEGGSYRWIYVPTPNKPQINNLQIPLGNGQKRMYPALSMANPQTVKQWGINQPYALVEVQVNDGDGSPAGDSFVATSMKVLDGSKEYPLKTPEVIASLQKRYTTYVKEQAKAINAALDEAQKKALKDKKVTGPRETSELMHVTWLPEAQRLRVHFRTKIADGSYTYVEVGGKGPFPLPPGPGGPGKGGLLKAPPAPPRPVKMRIGTTFGIEFGMAYEVSKTGKLERTQILPFESFQSETRVPAGAVGVPLPPEKK
jgi:hypothetical protein